MQVICGKIKNKHKIKRKKNVWWEKPHIFCKNVLKNLDLMLIYFYNIISIISNL